MKEADKDMDGLISYKEFMESLLSDWFIYYLLNKPSFSSIMNNLNPDADLSNIWSDYNTHVIIIL